MISQKINQYFEKFRKKISPTEIELQKARNRRDHVINILRNKSKMSVLKIINSGSYAKGTAIHPLNDLDIFVYFLESSDTNTNQQRILNQIARTLRPSFINNDINVGNRSVKVKYADGFIVDIVPAFSRSKDELEPAKIIDRETNKWIETSPTKHLKFIKKMKELDPRFHEFVRMFKTWKKNRRRNYRSFFIELLIADSLLNVDLSDKWDVAIYQIFENIYSHKLDKKICFNFFYNCPKRFPNNPVIALDPVNPKNNVAEDFTNKIKQEFLNSWNDSYIHAKKAVNTDIISVAKREWREVFNQFPSKI